MYKLKFTKLQNEIFRLMCIKAGTGLAQREIAGLLGVSPTAVSKSLKLLEREGLVRVERFHRVNLSSVRLNRDSPKALALKRVENLRMISESGLAEFLEERFPGCVIILFGSYSLGEDTMESDIDIAIVGSGERDIDLARFERMLERRIVINCYEDFMGINKNLKGNILNGITLHGGIEL